jgi:hypothetical protein
MPLIHVWGDGGNTLLAKKKPPAVCSEASQGD